MQIFKINKKIQIVCDTLSTRNGFKHEASLILNGYDIDKVKINYLNRTWERFTYDSVIKKLAEDSKYLEDKERKLIKKFVDNRAN